MNKKVEKITPKKDEASISNLTLYLITIALTIVYFIFSRFSNGFYMHDEVANFLDMQNFWSEPMSLFGAAAKTGYKLFYVLPALGGYTFLHFFNSLIAAFTVFFAYKILDKLGYKKPLLIFFLLGLQPLWFMLSFRNYAEMLVAFLLVFGVYQHVNKKYIFAALTFSFVAFSRTELHVISGLYFLWLVFHKKWLAALLTGTFTVINLLVSFAMSGDILHLIKETKAYSDSIKDAYPRQGFDHYFLMSSVIFGSTSIVLFFNYLGICILKKIQPNWVILITTVVIFGLNALFNAQFMEFGPGNGGNLRYLLPIAPLLSILGIVSIYEVSTFTKKYLLLLFLVPALIAIGIFQTFEHNFVKFTEVKDWSPLLFAIIAIVLLILPLKLKHYLISFSILALMVTLSIVDTRKIQPEEEIVKKAAKWYNDQIKQSKNPQNNNPVLFTEDSRLALEHALFYFYSEKNRGSFKNKPVGLTKEATDTLKKGDLVIWESHYGYRPQLRPTSLKYEDYENDPRFQKIQYYQSSDNRFTIVFFLKVS
ncbi:MAG: hypothetical protein HYU68_12435 [Bacteroidetes bacterium]|nr:hypothetical protein [Bacteroidota bacterium]